MRKTYPKQARVAFAAAIALGASVTAQAGDGWLTSFEEAKKQAAEGKKDILMDFTGSDWCHWCVKLDEEVFNTEKFKAEGTKAFVLLKLDFPNDKSKVTEAEQAQNKELAEKFGIRGYPTILLADATGKEFARTGYQPGGPEAYLTHLTELKAGAEAFDDLIGKAKAAEGIERAKLLDQALDTRDPRSLFESHADVVAEIEKLDADGAAGLKSKYGLQRAKGELGSQLNALFQKQDFDGMLAAVNSVIDTYKPTGTDLQEMLFHRMSILALSEKATEAQATLDELTKIDPEADVVKAATMQLQRMTEMQKMMKERAAKPAPAPAAE